jgi:hypothetical protein
MEMSLDVRSFLSAEDVVADYRAETKEQLLNALCARATKATHLDVQLVLGEILKREQLGCTGIGGGIAIPHARLQNLKKPFGGLVRLRAPDPAAGRQRDRASAGFAQRARPDAAPARVAFATRPASARCNPGFRSI